VRFIALGFFLAGTLLAMPRCARALDSPLDVSQYAHTAWKVRDGFTKGLISSIAQTPDGYLWLGTEFGLLRFDGIRATPWLPPGGEQLPSSYISNLLVARDGTLWIATPKGVASWKDGKLTQYPEVAGSLTTSFLEDREGTIWFGAYLPGRLCVVRGGKVECFGAGNFGTGVFALYEQHNGNLWASSSTGVWRWKPGPPEHYTLPSGVIETNAFIEREDGTLLLATNGGLKQLAGGRIQNYTVPGLVEHFRPRRFLQTRDGSLWVGGVPGLLHLHQGRVDTFRTGDGLSGDSVSPIFEDREGNVWVGTANGLDRFREYAVPTISVNQGLSSSDAYAVQATQDGTIWIATSDGMNRWANGHTTVYGRYDTPSQRGLKDEQALSISGPTTNIASSGLVGTPTTLGQDDQGRLWVATADGMFSFEGGRFLRVPGVPGGMMSSIAPDGNGNMWISNRKGLIHFASGGAVQLIPWSQLGFEGFAARVLLPDRSQGGVWLGFFEGGIAYFKGGQIRTSLTAADGLGNGHVNDLHFGSRGTLWAATESGLSYIREHRVVTLTSKNGLPCDEVHWLAEDDNDSFWLYMPCGLVRIARSELDAWVDDPRRNVQTTVFDTSDGVRTIAVYGGYTPHVTKSQDGKIWFVHRDGVTVVDPRHLPFNKLLPPVYVEQITADRKTYNVGLASSGQLRLPPLVSELEIDYTALSLAVPEKVRFRYKLEGFDRDWREAGNRRQVFYTNLPPRQYRFRVAACNNSGVWNEAGTFLDFSIVPAYYQTIWFRLACVLAFATFLWGLHQLRLRRIAREFNMHLEGRVSERTRIARELHDTLLQSFQGVLLSFQAGIAMLPGRPSEAKGKLEDSMEKAARAIAEGRDAVQDLRSSTVETNDLAAALSTLAEGLRNNPANQNAPAFEVQVRGETRDLHPILRDEIYRIAGEALRNAFCHAHATRIEVEIDYEPQQMRVCIRDDGRGIDENIVTEKGRSGHWGLRGMHERAKLIGAKLEVWSKPAAGAEIQLTIPAVNAYASAQRSKATTPKS
jgi:signal transduction histidine kinase/ligand-binding sensor domain-containing protein